jgi:hypothetical protein
MGREIDQQQKATQPGLNELKTRRVAEIGKE